MKILYKLIVACCIIVFSSCEKDTPVNPDNSAAEIVWSYPLPVKAFPDAVMPVIEDGLTYIASDSTLRCMELKTGRLVWQNSLGVAGNRIIQSQKLLLSGNLLFINHSFWIKAYDKNNGNLVWHTELNGFNSVDLSIMSQDNNSLLLGGQGEVVKVSKTTGIVELRIPLDDLVPAGYNQIAYNPVITEDGYIYVPTGWFDGLKGSGNILCYDAISGEYLWGYEINSDAGAQSCDISDSLVVFPSASSLYALNRFTGSLIWQTTEKEEGFWLSNKIHGQTVYMGSASTGIMYAFDLKTGKRKWKSVSTNSSIITIITVTNGRVYFCNFAYIYVLDEQTGSVIWKGLPPEYKNDRSYLYNSPVAVGDGYIVCGGTKKQYCLTVP